MGMSNANRYAVYIGKNDGSYGRETIAAVMDSNIFSCMFTKESVQGTIPSPRRFSSAGYAPYFATRTLHLPAILRFLLIINQEVHMKALVINASKDIHHKCLCSSTI
jgi:hypothetical protein